MHVLVVQYAGDYRDAVNRFLRNEPENYYAQQYSVEVVAKLKTPVSEVSVICCLTDEPYDEVLPNGVRAIGLGFQDKLNTEALLQAVAACKPTHLVVRTPLRALLSWAIQHRVRVLATLADSFQNSGLRSRIEHFRLARLLNHPQVEWVSNHGINACLSLQSIGTNPSKIIPWDWIYTTDPSAFAPKSLRLLPDSDAWQLLYVGAIAEAKGVGDALEAVARLKSQNVPVRLKLAGLGDIGAFTAQVKQLNIEENVEFLGMVPNRHVVKLMQAADLILVPSRHEYPEGLPLTIYEALCSRTPLIVSDHPMFAGKLRGGVNAMVFPAKNPIAFAAAIQTVLADPALYAHLSNATLDAWKQLQIPVKWGELLNRWLADTPDDRQWLFQHRLNSGQYVVP